MVSCFCVFPLALYSNTHLKRGGSKKIMNRIKFALVVMPRYSISVFIFLLLVAVFFYAGGTLHDPGSKGYSFTEIFLAI
ncbi:MAG: hypothetical protein Ct9H90mP20_4370 [Candidatus Neomarinimicrobiota bacterium]|nr:MAG: hypothetical protein Ct9H90mP20_4370 [Candidatus Neomarinimicrobiota bacterium]